MIYCDIDTNGEADLQAIADHFLKASCANMIPPEKALLKELAGIRLFSDPLIGYASADDAYILELKDAGGLKMVSPKEWLPSAQTVVSVFLPFTDEIKESAKNRGDRDAYEWLHGRIEGQACVMALLNKMKIQLESEGYDVFIPVQDAHYFGIPFPEDDTPEERRFKSNWSDRHVAYACGLGTFSMSKNIITSKGAAGRLGSLITSKKIKPTEHGYKDLYEYCTFCGACMRHCPAKAIKKDGSKDFKACSDFNRSLRAKYKTYYGCGKCFSDIPCQNGIPKKKE